jgi:hypothetical protein
MISESRDRTAEALPEIFHCLTEYFRRRIGAPGNLSSGIATLMKIAMNTLLFITYGFICFIFCLSLLINAFNTLDLKDLFNEYHDLNNGQ